MARHKWVGALVIVLGVASAAAAGGRGIIHHLGSYSAAQKAGPGDKFNNVLLKTHSQDAGTSLAMRIQHSRLLWRGGAKLEHESDLPADTTDALIVTEMRQDERWLYFQARHKAVSRYEGPVRLAAPDALLLVDGYPVKPPPVLGTVVFDREEPTWLQIALRDLPDGDLDLTIRAFGVQNTIPILKKEGSVAYMRNDMRRGFIKNEDSVALPAIGHDIAVEVR